MLRARVAAVLGFVLQQVSLGTGRLAPSVATVSVTNPIVGILIGVVLLDERLSQPTWHIIVAVIGLGLALGGAVVISLAREVPPRANPPRTRARPVARHSRDLHRRPGHLLRLLAAASPLVLAATFLVIRSDAAPEGIAFLSGFVIGTTIACVMGLVLGMTSSSGSTRTTRSRRW